MFVKYDIFLPCIEFFLFCILPDMGYNECPVCKALPDMGCNECPVCLASELVFSELMLRAEANDAPANIFQVTVLLVNLALKVGVNATPTYYCGFQGNSTFMLALFGFWSIAWQLLWL